MKQQPGNPLQPAVLEEFCKKHSITLEDFSRSFAVRVAIDFAEGVISYWQGDAAMNRLSGSEALWCSELAIELYEAFDEGEYFHDGDSRDSIGWQKYTLPAVMEVLARERLLPSA
ncbi:MAG: hypothetical protein GXC76_03525 [Rhodanobacteraceae bacterium]|nr:hypothetical protein [Rhodanobacteraceae bacterium]